MLQIKKYAAIDIGSNAVRLLISNIIEEKGQLVRIKKNSLVRVPIRLGEDVFMHQLISEKNSLRLVDTMLAFNLLMKSHNVVKYKACATSAMREASNGEKITKLIKQKTNISIDIIDGQTEATIIAATDLHQYIKENNTYLYVDVGGGSTEFTIYDNGKFITSKSYKIGTVRLIENLVSDETWTDLENWIKDNLKNYNNVDIIGSGGNINTIFKKSNQSVGKPLTYFYLSALYTKLKSLTYEKRIVELDLNQDRADVIIPATRIYLSAMKWSGAKDIYVPKIGLADGIIKSMYFKTINSNRI